MIDAKKLRVFLYKNSPKGMSAVENEMTIQAKAINLFKYLQAMQEKRDNIVLNYTNHQWNYFIKDLPDDPENIAFYYRDYVKFDEGYSALEEIPYILKVHNPDFDACPMPNEKLMPWLQEDWNDYNVEKPKIRERIPLAGSNPVVYREFRSVFDSQVMYDRWMEKRNLWRARQLVLEQTKNLFAELFMHRQRLIKEDGDWELLIANGVFQVTEDLSISHPILLKRVEIEFDTERNDIYIRDVDVNSSFYIELFNGIPDVDRDAIQNADAENSREQYYPFDRNATKTFFERVVHSISHKGKYFSNMELAKLNKDAAFKVSWEPMLILRQRPNGMAKMINKIIEKIGNTGEVPQHLINILQPGNNFVENSDYTQESTEEKLAAVGGEAIDILLPKEANQEQLDIAKTIEVNDAVVVQGPPGTGKTHTIANLLGHFLAQGKRVLVTSHTNKALKVLKDKVECELQPLCVSVTDDSRKDIESSIAAIANFSEIPAKLEKEIRECDTKRKSIIKQLNETRKKLFQIRNQQCNTIILNGEEFSPIDAAKFLKENRDQLGSIIPGNVYTCEALPVSYGALVELYDSNQSVSVDEEKQLACNLPDTADIWSASDFEQVVERYNNNKSIVDNIARQNNWKFTVGDAHINILDINSVSIQFTQDWQEKLLDAKVAVCAIKNYEEWELRVIADGINPIHRASWEQLVCQIKATYNQYAKVQRISFGKEVKFHSFEAARQHRQDYKKLIETDGKISFLKSLFNSSLTEAKTCVSINNAEISSGQDADLVLEYIRFYELENPCKIAWKSLFGEGVDNYSNIEIANKYAQSISQLLCWYNGAYSSIIYKIKASGIPMDDLMNIDPLAADIDNLRKSLIFSRGIVPQIIEGMLAFMEMRSQEKRLEKYYQRMSAGTLTNSTACMDIAGAIKRKDIEGYKKARNTLFALIGKYSLQNRRNETLAKINRYAPEWANAIKNRQGIHGSFTVPENIADAWKWKQLERIVNEINSCDYNTLQNNSMRLAKDYHKATAELAAAKAWYELQKRNFEDAERQCILLDLGQLIKKIGKGTGKNADRYKKLVREQMSKCQDAVPVWIMPVRKVLETFDPLTMKEPFDIIIVDEASQSDLTALAVTYLGKKVIIVGDDKQVSPLAVGQKEEPMQESADLYISSWLKHKKAIDLRTSLYDIGSSSFTPRMLLEHFRCVPEIIGYSNWLSYDNKIKPLREASSSNLLPAVVNYRVDGHRDGKSKINRVEARNIVALVQSCMEQPEYSGKTFGVISLLGKEQAEYIQRELFNTIGNIVYEQRQIICGDSANFQGDERDVIFLSMVDSNEGDGVLRLRSDDANEDAYKKRYNVAVSRAKDQLWVINSLDEENSLQAGDLRRGLLSYAKNPQAYQQTMIQIEQQSESPFEEEVAKALVSKGFHIVQQWEVGAYRIDMVAVYKNRKIAIECDGERYHSGEDKILEDMQRQTILERLGWKFIRIRGSEYFADPENTINRVADLLFTYGIQYEDNFTATSANRDTDLLQRVKQRAVEIVGNIDPTTGYIKRIDEVLQDINKTSEKVNKTAEIIVAKANDLDNKANAEKKLIDEVTSDARKVIVKVDDKDVKKAVVTLSDNAKMLAEKLRCIYVQVDTIKKAVTEVDKVKDDAERVALTIRTGRSDDVENLMKNIEVAAERTKKAVSVVDVAQANLNKQITAFNEFVYDIQRIINDTKKKISLAEIVIKLNTAIKYSDKVNEIKEAITAKARTLDNNVNIEKTKITKVVFEAKKITVQAEAKANCSTKKNKASEYRSISKEVSEAVGAVSDKEKILTEKLKVSSLQLNAIENVAIMANQTRTDKEKVVLTARKSNSIDIETLLNDVESAVEIVEKNTLEAEAIQTDFEKNFLALEMILREIKKLIDNVNNRIALAKKVIGFYDIRKLISLLDKYNVPYEDNWYSSEGAFWLIGEGGLSSVINKLKIEGFNFKYAEHSRKWLMINKEKNFDIRKTLDNNNIPYNDERSNKNGRLWISGEANLNSIIDIAEQMGVEFKFYPQGSRATNGKPGWWTWGKKF